MATISIVPVQWVHNAFGNTPYIREYPEAASQSFKAGEAVYINGSGYVAEYTTAIDDGTQRFLGYADQDAHNDAGNGSHNVRVVIPTDGDVFEANLYHSTAASAVTAITDPTNLWPMYEDAANSCVRVDKSNTGGQIAACSVLALSARDNVGDLNGRVLFSVVSAARQVLR